MFPLGMAIEHEQVKIVKIQGQSTLIQQLTAIGLAENVELQVLQKNSMGVVVSAGGSRWAVDVGTARKIMVIPVAKT